MPVTVNPQKTTSTSAENTFLSNPSVERRKKSASALGAPSQLNQTSRKGKRAWRKNVDIEDVEDVLEGLRAEERVTGSTLQKKKDDELFQIDTKGDDTIRSSVPKYRFSTSQLTSTKILSQRSAIPAVFSRPPTSSSAAKRKKPLVTHEEKGRLLRIAKRRRRGPLNAVLDPEESVMDLNEAVKLSGGYDPWVQEVEAQKDEDGFESMKKRTVKPPALIQPRKLIDLPAIPEPHQGTSYNPADDAHKELLLKAYDIERKRLKEEERLAELRQKMDQAQVGAGIIVQGMPAGMIVDEMVEEVQEGEVDGKDLVIVKPAPKKKTKAQRNKAARLLADKRSLAEKATKRQMADSIHTVKRIRRAADRTRFQREELFAKRRLAAQEKLKRGLAGQKLGKHRVKEADIDVQLGEDLSESLRALKPEGNLFRDRLLSMQQRALVEPRSLVIPRRRAKTKEYEKHPWKRFDRE